MAVPVPHVLAAGALEGLLVLLFAIVGFAVVAGVAVVILALLQAVLPSGDSGAEALHAQSQRDAEDDRADAAEEAVRVERTG